MADLSTLVQGIRAGEMRALARACRLIDERDPHAFELLKRVFIHDGHAYVVGVTGTPGAGKSTLVDGLIRLYREQGKRVAVLAIDPTSPYSGGAILGDRIRMQQHFTDEGVFIRSIAWDSTRFSKNAISSSQRSSTSIKTDFKNRSARSARPSRSQNAASGSTIQNSARWRVVLEFSARNVGPKV